MMAPEAEDWTGHGYFWEECSDPDCAVDERHWVVYHETGVEVSDHSTEEAARRECDRLNKEGGES